MTSQKKPIPVLDNAEQFREFTNKANDFVAVENYDALMQSVLENSNIAGSQKIIKGTVRSLDKSKRLACIDVHLKSEGTISTDEFFVEGDKDNLVEGAEVEVYLSKLDTRAGGVDISRAKAIREAAWNKLVIANKNDEIINGIAFSRVKGGVSVDFDGVIAFLPGSQIDVRPVKDISNIIGKSVGYKILSIDVKNHSVIVSRKAILESEKSEDREKFLDGVVEGDVLNGVVKNITNYGAFVDLGDVDGLLHVTDISWEKISHPSEVLKIGQRVTVKIIKYDREGKRLSLGMKQLGHNPWEQIKDKYIVGKVVKGKVIDITSYGVFVHLDHGVEGLLHISEMSWTKDSYKKYKSMEVGQELDVAILDVDIEKHRIALSMKHMTENPWEKFAHDYNTGQILEGVVRNITDFGVFVGVDGVEVDGLVHVSDLTWGGDPMTEIARYKKDDPIKVIYLGSDLENQRIRFGVKQLSDDPFENNKHLMSKDKVLTCKVVAIKPDGIEVELFDSVRSFIKKINIAREKVEQRPEKFVVGDRIDVKVTQYDAETRKVTLSIRALEEDEHSQTVAQYGSADTGATIGKMLGDAFNSAMAKQNEDADK
jgi:small subunit ribosomal protein S1